MAMAVVFDCSGRRNYLLGILSGLQDYKRVEAEKEPI